MTPVERAAFLAQEIMRLLRLPNWDAHIFHIASLKAEFKELIAEHKLTPEQIHSCIKTTENSN